MSLNEKDATERRKKNCFQFFFLILFNGQIGTCGHLLIFFLIANLNMILNEMAHNHSNKRRVLRVTFVLKLNLTCFWRSACLAGLGYCL